MKRALMILAAGIFVIGACDKPSTPETKTDDPSSKNASGTGTTTANAATATATAATTAATPPVIAETDLATPADFEETAEKAISKANYKSELASLEKDIAKE